MLVVSELKAEYRVADPAQAPVREEHVRGPDL